MNPTLLAAAIALLARRWRTLQSALAILVMHYRLERPEGSVRSLRTGTRHER